jgi:hypothetical protein
MECGGGADAGNACTCDDDCTEEDEAPAPTDTPSVAPVAPSGIALPASTGLRSALSALRAAPRAAGPPARLPLRI